VFQEDLASRGTRTYSFNCLLLALDTITGESRTANMTCRLSIVQRTFSVLDVFLKIYPLTPSEPFFDKFLQYPMNDFFLL